MVNKRSIFTCFVSLILPHLSWGQGSGTPPKTVKDLGVQHQQLINELDELPDDPYTFFEEMIEELEKEWVPISPGDIHQLRKDKENRPGIEKDADLDDIVVKGEVVHFKEEEHSQPVPLFDIQENDETSSYRTFHFYGTPLRARWDDMGEFRFGDISNKSISKGYKQFSAIKYKNLLYDCLKIRKVKNLCDWAYYKMLQALTETIFGKGTNEATFLHGWLLEQSGYEIRFAKDNQDRHLHILCKTNVDVMGYKNYKTDGDNRYYIFEQNIQTDDLVFCPYAYGGEKEMSLMISVLPELETNLQDECIVYDSKRQIRIPLRINKNLTDFFKDYPIPIMKKNLTDIYWKPLWIYYANAPTSKEISDQVYKLLKKELKGDPIKDVNTILGWVCPYDMTEAKNIPAEGKIGIPYIHDNENIGHDQPFFPDETLKGPGGDCEDHAILFARLVRDLLNLDVVLLWYEEHLAAGVHIDTDIKGKKVNNEEDGKLYYVCDPSCRHAKVGLVTTSLKKATPVIFKLN